VSLCYIHQVNLVNSRSVFTVTDDDSAIKLSRYIIMVIMVTPHHRAVTTEARNCKILTSQTSVPHLLKGFFLISHFIYF